MHRIDRAEEEELTPPPAAAVRTEPVSKDAKTNAPGG
jgi:hypothetical protein